MVLLHAHVDSPVERGITVMGRNIVQMIQGRSEIRSL